jgi:hypothetical protein
VYAFLRLGFTEEAARFMEWLTARWKERDSHGDGPLRLSAATQERIAGMVRFCTRNSAAHGLLVRFCVVFRHCVH